MGSSKDYTEAEVKEQVKVGATREDIVKFFGAPADTSNEDGGRTILFYIRPLRKSGKDDSFGGFEVYLERDRVTGWEPIRTTGPQ